MFTIRPPPSHPHFSPNRETTCHCYLLIGIGGGSGSGGGVTGGLVVGVVIVVDIAAVAGTSVGVVDMGLIDSRLGAHELGLVLSIDTGVGAVVVEVSEEDVEGSSKDGTSERSKMAARYNL